MDGRVLRGANGFAGEFSFIRNDAQAPVSMGNIFGGTGSWRTLVALMLSEKGLEDDGTVDGRRAFEWVAAGDEAARRGLDRYALMFDNMLLNLQAVLDPNVFAIAGGISCHPELMEALERQMESRSRASRVRSPGSRGPTWSPLSSVTTPTCTVPFRARCVWRSLSVLLAQRASSSIPLATTRW